MSRVDRRSFSYYHRGTWRVAQRSNADGFPKAGEVIEMTGLEDLEASQRAISNLLYQHAHDSGRITEPGAVFEANRDL